MPTTTVNPPEPDSQQTQNPPPERPARAPNYSGPVLRNMKQLRRRTRTASRDPSRARRPSNRPYDQDRSRRHIKYDGPKIPLPPQRIFREGDEQKFFDYWHETDNAYPNRLVAYLYRHFPVIDRERIGKQKNIGSHSIPIVSVRDLMKKEGWGDYSIIVNDAGGHRNQLCTGYIRTPRDYAHMPKIEMEDLVLDDPANQSYIQKLRTQGVQLPGDSEEYMQQQNEAVGQLVGLVERFMLKQDQDNFRRRQDDDDDDYRRRRRVDEEEYDTLRMSNAAVDVTADAAKRAMKMVEDAASRSGGQNSMGPKDIIEIARMMRPEGGGGQELLVQILTLSQEMGRNQIETITKISDSRVQSLETMLKDMREEIRESRKPNPEPEKDAFDLTIERQSKLRELFGSHAAKAPDSEDSGDKWLKILSMGLPLLAPALQALGSAWVASSYNRAAAQAQGPPGSAPPPNLIRPEEVSQQQAQQAQQPSEEEQAGTAFINFISGPLLTHLNSPDSTGGDFAEWIVYSGLQGRMIYTGICEQGKEAFVQSLQSSPQLWGQLQNIQGKLSQFLDEFFAYDLGDSDPDGDTLSPDNKEPEEVN